MKGVVQMINVKVLSERIDRNGTKHQTILDACDRCGGEGRSERWAYSGFICYKCGGGRVMEKKRKIYTPEHQTKLDARREAKAQKLLLERKENAKANNQKQLKEWGYAQDLIHVVLGETFQIKDELREAGARYNHQLSDWFFTEKPEGFETFPLETQRLIHFNYAEEVCKTISEEVFEYINRECKKATPEPPQSNFVGEVGEKIEIELDVVASFWIESQFGSTCINKMVDPEGNLFLWITNQSLEGLVKLKGRIKDHSVYDKQKQTVLTRCKVQ